MFKRNLLIIIISSIVLVGLFILGLSVREGFEKSTPKKTERKKTEKLKVEKKDKKAIETKNKDKSPEEVTPKVEPPDYSIVESKPSSFKTESEERLRFSYILTIPQNINEKEAIIAAIIDLMNKKETGDAVMIFVYGEGDDTKLPFTKARASWSKDGKGWTGYEEEVDKRLIIDFTDGTTEYREFSK